MDGPDNLPASPGIFGGLPVVYLHASSARRNDRIVFTLLRDTKTPISAVAALCGWRSDIALRWLFRRRTGMSMRQWRRENTISFPKRDNIISLRMPNPQRRKPNQ